MNNIWIPKQININGEEDKIIQLLGNMEIMNIIGIQFLNLINLKQKVLNNILIMDISMNNIGTPNQIQINGEEDKLIQLLGNMVNMNTIGILHLLLINSKQKRHRINNIHIMVIFMNNIGIVNLILINGGEDKPIHKHGNMENMSIIGIKHHLHINLKQKKLKIHNNTHIMGIFMNNIGIQNPILINGEEDKLIHKHGNMVNMNIIGIQTQMDMLGE